MPLTTSIRVQFDRFLAPTSTVRQAICVQSCTVGGPSSQCEGQCLGGLSPEYDPVDRVVVWKGASLVAGLRYNVRLLVPANADDPTGVRAIDGAPLAKEYTFAFTAGDPAKMPPDPDAIKPELAAAESVVNERASINFCSKSKFCPVPMMGCTMPAPTFTGTNDLIASCAVGSSCHGPTQVAPGPQGSALVLKDLDGGIPGSIIRLVNGMTVATESAVGPDPNVPVRGPRDARRFANDSP